MPFLKKNKNLTAEGWRRCFYTHFTAKVMHILSISKGKLDSAPRTKREEIQVPENQRKSDLDSRRSDGPLIAGWRPSIRQMKDTFVLNYLQGRGGGDRERALIRCIRFKLPLSRWEMQTRLPAYLFSILKSPSPFYSTNMRWKEVSFFFFSSFVFAMSNMKLSAQVCWFVF